MRRLAAVLLVCGVGWTSSSANADTPQDPSAPSPASSPAPGADQIQFAAREHDLGYRAYLERQYEEAASHFENAFFAAPDPAELRSAVRARRDAGELARAATLAAIGQRRFPDDPATKRVAEEVMGQARPHVYEVRIASSVEYSVAVDAKMVTAERVKDSSVFLNPGTHELVVSWSDDRNMRIPIEGTEGGSTSLQLEPPALAPPAPSPPDRPVLAARPSREPEPPVMVAAPDAVKPLSPVVFVVGAALTAVAAGITLWSGIDAINHPGASAVRENCVGLGTDCPTYQEGRAAQLRTDVLLATTSLFAVATAVVGVFFTQWPRTAAAEGPLPGARSQALPVRPTVGIGPGGVQGTF